MKALVFAAALLSSLGAHAQTLERTFSGCCDFGSAVAHTGDLNGDGQKDFLVAAFGAGRIYAFSARSSEPLWSSTFGGDFGFSLASAGDVNGDGVPDVIVGAPSAANGGVVRLLSGRDGSLIREIPRVGATNFFGYAVSALGDVDGDGASDLLVGAPGGGGNLHVLSGATGSLMRTVQPPSGGEFGAGVAVVEDIDRDGIRDYIVGAPSALGGRAYVFSGSSHTLLLTLAAPIQNGRFAEFFVADAGDVNADGTTDLYVGNYAESGFSGAAYVFSGSNGALLHRFGGVAGEGMGTGRSAGDIDGDGHSDLVVGSYIYSGAGVRQGGRVSLFSGADGSVLGRVNGARDNGQFGFDAVGLGDVTGDGKLDFVVGSAPVNRVELYGAPMVSSVTAFRANEGLSGLWYEPATSGQGFYLDVQAQAGGVAGVWFTHPGLGDEAENGLRWFTFQGSFVDDQAETTIFNTTGGVFDEPSEATTTIVGSLSIHFLDCTHAIASYVVRENAIRGIAPRDQGPIVHGRIELQRLSPSVFCDDSGTPQG